MNLERAPARFVVPALAGPGLAVSNALTVNPGPAKAGTTNRRRSPNTGLSRGPVGRRDNRCERRTIEVHGPNSCSFFLNGDFPWNLVPQIPNPWAEIPASLVPFVVPALAGPGLAVSNAPIVNPGPAKAGTTNRRRSPNTGLSKGPVGRRDNRCQRRTIEVQGSNSCSSFLNGGFP